MFTFTAVEEKERSVGELLIQRSSVGSRWSWWKARGTWRWPWWSRLK
jgi:hypothetical protein